MLTLMRHGLDPHTQPGTTCTREMTQQTWLSLPLGSLAIGCIAQCVAVKHSKGALAHRAPLGSSAGCGRSREGTGTHRRGLFLWEEKANCHRKPHNCALLIDCWIAGRHGLHSMHPRARTHARTRGHTHLCADLGEVVDVTRQDLGRH